MICPLCGQEHQCGIAIGGPGCDCWCFKERFPDEIFEQIPPELRGKACICKTCLDSCRTAKKSIS